VNGTNLPPGNPTLVKLVTALQNLGNPLVPITAVSFVETLFGLSADLKYDPAYDQATVKKQVLQTLYQSFGFAARSFGQGVSADEVATVIQAVPGVVAVNVKQLNPLLSSAFGDLGLGGAVTLSRRSLWMAMVLRVPLWRLQPPAATQIYPSLPVANLKTLPTPAEILVLSPDSSSVNLGVM
jgi:hypothetical protein